MATGGDDRLTNEHFARLAASIVTRDLESVAIRYLGISVETIKSLRDQHRDNLEAHNRDILQKWAYKNPGYDQVKVMRLISELNKSHSSEKSLLCTREHSRLLKFLLSFLKTCNTSGTYVL